MNRYRISQVQHKLYKATDHSMRRETGPNDNHTRVLDILNVPGQIVTRQRDVEIIPAVTKLGR
jgi:hypothetical protein